MVVVWEEVVRDILIHIQLDQRVVLLEVDIVPLLLVVLVLLQLVMKEDLVQ
jgi:hypothetical protein